MISRVILDIGHGLNSKTKGIIDPGAMGVVPEHTLAALLVGGAATCLQLTGVNVMIAPEESLNGVVEWANKIARPGDLFVSVHCNSATPQATGVEVLYHHKAGKRRIEQAAFLSKSLADLSGLRDRGALADTSTPAGATNGLAMLRDTRMPALLVEAGFVSNKMDVTVMYQGGGMFFGHSLLRLIARENEGKEFNMEGVPV